MAIAGGLLTRRALLLAKVESTPGQDALPVASLDAIQVSDPEFSIDPNILERDFVSPDLDPHPHIIGRKLASVTFTTELKGNGTEQSGLVVTDEPKLARLFRGCGYALSGAQGLITAWTTNFAVNNDLTMPAEQGADHNLFTGDGPVQVATNGGTLPTGLAVNTDYWVIRKSGTALALATSRANALAGTEVVLSVADASGNVQLICHSNVHRPNFDQGNSSSEPSDLAIYVGGQEGQSPMTEPSVAGPVLWAIEVTTGGASGAAQVSVTSNNTTDGGADATGVTVTSGTQIALGTTGAYFVMEWTGNLVLGDKYYILVDPDGIRVQPISTGFECLTLYLYEDGLRYRTLANQGTFTIDATAGNFGSVEFTFTGQFTAITDAALPTDEVFEKTLPQQVELGLLTWGSNVSLKAEQWTFDQANNVVPRPDVNQTDGFSGVRISDRTPAGGFNPEAELVATEDFWGDFSAAVQKVFTARTGTTAGNQVVVYGPRVQTSEIGFGDRDGIRSFEHGLLFKRREGNDSVEWTFA